MRWRQHLESFGADALEEWEERAAIMGEDGDTERAEWDAYVRLCEKRGEVPETERTEPQQGDLFG